MWSHYVIFLTSPFNWTFSRAKTSTSRLITGDFFFLLLSSQTYTFLLQKALGRRTAASPPAELCALSCSYLAPGEPKQTLPPPHHFQCSALLPSLIYVSASVFSWCAPAIPHYSSPRSLLGQSQSPRVPITYVHLMPVTDLSWYSSDSSWYVWKLEIDFGLVKII